MNHTLYQNIHRRLRGLCSRADYSSVEAGVTGSRLRPKQSVLGGDPLLRCSEGSGKRRVLLAVDMSGSMTQTWNNLGGREIAMGMLALHLSGELHVDILLSGSIGWHRMSMTRAGLSALEKCGANGGSEGLADTFAQNEKLLRAAATVIVLTDGYLTDGEVVNKQWRQRGVDMIAVCPCESRAATMIQSAASRFFTRAFADADPCAVITRAVSHAIREK